MDLHDNFNRIHQLTNKKDLTEYIEKRFTTSIIGTISSIEEHFFDLFTDEEWGKYWAPLRDEILNKGNAQKRLALKELDKYDFNQKRKGKTEENYNR